MASKKKAAASAADANFSFFQNLSTGNKLADSSKKLTTSTWIDTGCYAFNAIYCGDMKGGFPGNRVSMLAGREAVGKTFFAIYAHMIPLIRDGYFVFYIDTEGAVDEDMLMNSFGIEPLGYDSSGEPVLPFKIIRESTIQEARRTVCNILDGIEADMGKDVVNHNKCAFILDSQGQMTTMKNLEDSSSGNFKKDMTKAGELKLFYAAITNRMTMLGIPMIVTNHVYADVGSFIPRNEVSGGSGGLYASSVILELRKKQYKEGTVKKGTIVTTKTRKSRWCPDGLEVSFYLDFKKGFNPWYGVHLLAQEAGYLEPWSASHASMGCIKPKVGNAKCWVCKHPDKEPSEWVVCRENELHKESAIGSIFEPVNEWVKKNYRFTTANGFDLKEDEDLDVTEDDLVESD